MRSVAPLTPAERAGFIAAARAMVGTPFRHRGRTARGVDCIGLVALAIQSREIADRDDYSRNPVNDGLRSALTAHFGAPVEDLQPGDVLLMCWGRDEDNHVAVVFEHPCGGLAIVHALAQARRVIEHSLAPEHVAMITGIFRP